MNGTIFYYLLMSQKDLLQNQGIEEILRERSTYYLIRKKEKNFWITVSPSFINSLNIKEKIKSSNFYNQKLSSIKSLINSNSEFYATLISSDKDFINWMKVRLGAFEELTQVNNNKNTRYDGIFGYFKINDNNKNINPLKSFKNYLHPDIFIERNKKFLNLHYKYIENNF